MDDDSRQGNLQGFEAAVDFAGDRGFAISDDDLGGEGGLRPVLQGGEHLAGLVGVVVDGLFAADDELRLFLVAEGFQELGDGQRLEVDVGFDEDAAVGTDGHGGAQGFLAGSDAAGDGDDFSRDAGFLETDGFFDGDFVKGVHAHLDVGEVDSATVRLHAYLDVVVHYPFHGDENFHKALLSGQLILSVPFYYRLAAV